MSSSFRLFSAAFLFVSSEALAGGIPNDPDFVKQWGLLNAGQMVNGAAGKAGADVRAPAAWERFGGTSNVVVAIVGTGVDAHPEFADRLLEGWVAPLAGGDPYSTLDVINHGTRIAGIIAASRNDGQGIAGLNDRAWILPVRVFDGPSGSQAAVAQGVTWAAENGASIIVVPLQFYGVPSKELADAVAYASSRDLLVIAPAGHDGVDTVTFPAALPECLAVASTNNLDEVAEFSNFGDEVDLSAPGTNIWSTAAGGDYGFEEGDTGAWAAAYAAGVASLIRSYAPQLTAGQVRQILVESADDLGEEGWDAYHGAGRLNADRALQMTTLPAFRFEYDRLPARLDAQSPTEFIIRIANGSQQVVAPLARVLHRTGQGAFTAVPLQHIGGEEYRVVLPATACSSTLEYYFRAVGSGGAALVDPPGAPATLHRIRPGRTLVFLEDDFETDKGWTTVTAGPDPTGAWQRVVPVGTIAQPDYDFTPDYGEGCFLTGQYIGGSDGANDVDYGPFVLLSPVVPITTDDAEVSYARWFFTQSPEGLDDALTVEVTRDGGFTWAVAETVSVTTPWTTHTFRLSEFPQLSGGLLQLRFTTSDLTDDSLTEAAIDDVRVRERSCTALAGDANGDGAIDGVDFATGTDCWRGPAVHNLPESCEAFDFDNDWDADLEDLARWQNAFGPG